MSHADLLGRCKQCGGMVADTGRSSLWHKALCALGLLSLSVPLSAQDAPAVPGGFLFVWAGSRTNAPRSAPANAMLVLDADRRSPTYGRLLNWIKTDRPSVRVHHTEYLMPAGGVLFANDHDAGLTYRIDMRDPRQPKILGQFETMAGLAMPHSFVRTPAGTVLATFMHRAEAEAHLDHSGDRKEGGISGGLVEIDDQGRMIRAASNQDSRYPGELLSPYGLVVMPDIDRVLSTNSAMNSLNGPGSTVQLWRLSTLELLETRRLDPGPTGLGDVDPEEPRRGPDGSVYVQTLSCSLQRITGLAAGRLQAQFVYRFPGGGCGVPTIVDHWLIQSVPYLNGLVVLDLTDPTKPVEVSRIAFPDRFSAHWTSWDPSSGRIVTTGSSRVYVLDLDRETGRITLDERFSDGQGAPGFDLAKAGWALHNQGQFVPHGAIFSR